jgi:hypothetical protein
MSLRAPILIFAAQTVVEKPINNAAVKIDTMMWRRDAVLFIIHLSLDLEFKGFLPELPTVSPPLTTVSSPLKPDSAGR